MSAPRSTFSWSVPTAALCWATSRSVQLREDNMQCPDCENENPVPQGKAIHVSDFLEGDVDVDASQAIYTQLECRDCGAVLGYHGIGAAVGSSNIRGFY